MVHTADRDPAARGVSLVEGGGGRGHARHEDAGLSGPGRRRREWGIPCSWQSRTEWLELKRS